MSYKNNTNLIINEINECLENVNIKETEELIKQILKAQRVFITAVGRVSLSLQCFGKRLSHLGVNVDLVGSLTEKPATNKDLLIVASGSGESILPLNIAKKAKSFNTKIALITSAKTSSLKKISNLSVTLKAPTKPLKHGKIKNQNLSDSASKSNTAQPMSSLFDQALHIYGDIISMIIFERKKFNKNEIWKYHANLE